MKEKIEIKNILKYEKNAKGVRISFCFCDPKMLANNGNFKGYSINDCFYDDVGLFDKLPIEIINKQVDVTLKSVPSARNPMTSMSKIDKIYYNGSVISLLPTE